MYNIKTYNNIAQQGLDLFSKEEYSVSSDAHEPDAIVLRSANLHDEKFLSNLLAIARAGAGVNNVPIEQCTERGIVVFNTPGANANAVKELVLTGILLASRNICQAWQYVQALEDRGDELKKKVEQGKKQFVGFELTGKTLGVIGLGSIGVKVANMAMALGMRVIGFDPAITVKNSWQLSSQVEHAEKLETLLSQSDFVTLHVPLIEKTKNLLNGKTLKILKSDAVVLNFSRAGIVDNDALFDALNANTVRTYVCDFPSERFRGHEKVIALPHLGASTKEAETNCAIMAVNQLKDYLETGNITNSVNFPAIQLPKATHYRLAIVNQNVPNMVSQISTVLADAGLNIVDLLNKSRGDVAYTLLDVDSEVNQSALNAIQQIDGVIKARLV